MKTETLPIPVAIVFFLLFAGVCFYFGIRWWRDPDDYASQCANLIKSVIGEERFNKEKKGWLRILRRRGRMQGLIGIAPAF
ncbi:MAG: hypothetical protein JSS77_02930 [Acidobacteria bacterium]|nr:hypothetical protein [Acidobacteriota bacterium]